MVQAPSLAALDALRNPNSAQHDSLKQLKNSIIGHDQVKESVIKHGVLEILVAISAGEARLQSTIVLGSLASGGAAYVKPMVAAGVPQYLLETLGRREEYKVVTASLRAMKGLAGSW
jgi:hypothetical protein